MQVCGLCKVTILTQQAGAIQTQTLPYGSQPYVSQPPVVQQSRQKKDKILQQLLHTTNEQENEPDCARSNSYIALYQIAHWCTYSILYHLILVGNRPHIASPPSLVRQCPIPISPFWIVFAPFCIVFAPFRTIFAPCCAVSDRSKSFSDHFERQICEKFAKIWKNITKISRKFANHLL